jgi:hypothetical protein
MLKTKFLLSLFLLLSPAISMAAAMIESRDGDGDITRIYIKGDKARIEMPRQEGFMVMDVRNKTMKVVMHKDRMVMDMSDLFKSSKGNSQQSSQPYVDSYIKTKGLGPTIAGFETEEYEVFGDGKYCGSAFVSVRALNDVGLRKFAKAFDEMTDQIERNMSGMFGGQIDQYMDPCDQADKKLTNQLESIGFPLKSIDKNRRLESVVTKISRNARLPANAFVIPKNYKQTNPSKMMNDAAQKMKQMQPQMQNMMKNMPPEMRDMIKQQMQQYQR